MLPQLSQVMRAKGKRLLMMAAKAKAAASIRGECGALVFARR